MADTIVFTTSAHDCLSLMQLDKVLLIPALLGVLLLPATARSQKSYVVGITAGAAIPTGKFNDIHSKGSAITGFLGFGAGELPIGVRFDGLYHTFPGRTVTPAGGGADITTPELRLWGIGGNFVLTTSGSTAKPYLIAGAGFYNSKPDSAGAKSQNDLGFSGGLGSSFSLGPFASVVEVRFHSISREPADGGSIHFVPIVLGIMF